MRKKGLLLLLTVIAATIVVSMMSAGATTLYGDLNADGSINSTDLMIMKRVLLKQRTLDDITPADLNGDGKVTSTDYSLMKRYLLKEIDKFPVEDIEPTPTLEVSPTPTETSEEVLLLKLNYFRMAIHTGFLFKRYQRIIILLLTGVMVQQVL